MVAAFLHYFLLALFSWMLCEGALHYILLVKVFGGGAGDKVKYFYVFGWGRLACFLLFSLMHDVGRIKVQDMLYSVNLCQAENVCTWLIATRQNIKPSPPSLVVAEKVNKPRKPKTDQN